MCSIDNVLWISIWMNRGPLFCYPEGAQIYNVCPSNKNVKKVIQLLENPSLEILGGLTFQRFDCNS